ncbi:MAG: phosphate starvation-inducible protein PhoH [Candidatus Marinimicrobia bacterium]|nr:phosphate starvation-inducible protein PhoH [Candidatus Neomarinimicrobiota bacterium]RPG05973.1 MAG: PhoH family protein [Pelagibacteraceae bacterium TMED247]|tara:strand:+ start:2167 stop:3180 length:1014 start_codon:yes stop_codon:yes gene_type:complete
MLEAKNLEKQILIKKIDNKTLNIKIFDNKMLMAVVGEFNTNLTELEKLTNTKLFFRGNSITAKGNNDSILSLSESLKYLANKFLITNSIENGDIISSIKNNMYDTNEKNKNNVRPLGQIIKTPKRSVVPRSKKQSEYLEALINEKIVISLGPAGTGKSYLAVSVAVKMLMEKKVERVILSRPAVEAGERLGFLPGDMKDKVDPYLRPLYDALYDLFGFEKIQKKIETGEIEIAPLAFMRGRTLKNSFAILDEAQNASLTQIKMFLTRIGENSKLVVNGDPSQIDLMNKNDSGLLKTKRILEEVKEVKFVEFDHNDVARHPLVAKIVKAYQKKIDDKN